MLTFSVARGGFDLGFGTAGCASGRAHAFIMCVPDYLDLICVIIHEVKSSQDLLPK